MGQSRSLALDRRILAIYLSLSILLALVHGFHLNLTWAKKARVQRHEAIVHQQAESPFGYRILVPNLVEVTRPALMRFFDNQRKPALEWSYIFWRWVFTFGLLILFHLWLERWLDPPWAFTGVLLLAALHPPSYLFYWFQPASCLDFLLWTLTALVTLKGRWFWLIPVILVGGLNRETILFAVFIYLALSVGRVPLERLVQRSVVLLATWALTFFGLRMVIGPLEVKVRAISVLQENLNHPSWFLYAFIFFGLFWLVPFLGWSRYPAPLRRLAVVLIPYLGIVVVFGRIREVRLLLPLSLVLIPMGLLYLRDVMGVTRLDPETASSR